MAGFELVHEPEPEQALARSIEPVLAPELVHAQSSQRSLAPLLVRKRAVELVYRPVLDMALALA